MMMYKNLQIIGTSHIAISSIKEVRKVILEERPDFIALELDKDRLLALMSDKKRKVGLRDIRKLGFSGFLFAVFGQWVEEKLGKMVGTKPGGEMREAVKCAAKIKAKIALVDQKIDITIKNLMKTITFKEKIRFVWDIVKGVVFRKGDIERFDLKKVPPEKLIEKMIISVQKRYPSVYKTLVEDRNIYMGKKLHRLMTKFPDSKIVVIIGAGHEEGLVEEIKKYK
jgi:pheromone shutdown-related protein TraB